MIVAAEVKTVEMKSSCGVDDRDRYEITLSRQLVSEEEELQVKAESQWIQKAASLIVDKAADIAGVSRQWARQVALYEPYQLSLKETIKDNKGDSEEEEENQQGCSSAAKHFLLNKVGNLQDVQALVSLLVPGSLLEEKGMNENEILFAHELHKLCQKEAQRIAQPTTFSLKAAVGDPLTVSKAMAEADAPKETCSVDQTKALLASLLSEESPTGFGPLEITVAGAGTFKLSVKGPKTLEEKGMCFLNAVVFRARETWERIVSSPKEDVAEETEVEEGDGGYLNHTHLEDQPSFNIGIIGDVANGKSTLVHAMSGKRTQAHSSEQQKHGMTIRLGFANAAIVHCREVSKCGSYSFMSEKDMSSGKDPACPLCKGTNVAIVKRVSFIDCPGHAELMATMLGGSSAFDAALFVAAANAPCPSPQARQHLEALKASKALHGKNRLAIVQTKAELVAKQAVKNLGGLSAAELLSHHSNAAKGQLKGTVAANAPFFPTCAPRGLGLEPIAKWLASLPSKSSTFDRSAFRVFRVLRSFDVNRPGTDVNNMVGGVIGGTINGPGVITKGDILEVRPGLLVGRKQTGSDGDDGKTEEAFDVRPWQLCCLGLMTGKTPLEAAKRGGLVALQTTLNPSLCADDRLVGAVVGPTKMLPPVWGPGIFLDHLRVVDVGAISSSTDRRSLSDRLKKGARVMLHCGSSTVPGVVKKISLKRGKVEVVMKQPLCAFKGSKIALEAEERTGLFSLAAHATLRDGTCCLDGADEPKEENDEGRTDMPSRKEIDSTDDDDDEDDDDDDFRARFLEELESTKNQVDSDAAGAIRVSCPNPQFTRDGGFVVLDNFAAIGKALNRDPDHLKRFLEKEGGVNCVRAGEGGSGLRVRWKSRGGFPQLFDKMLYRYCRDFVTCPQCLSAKTEFLKACGSKDRVEQQCRLCNARRFVPKI